MRERMRAKDIKAFAKEKLKVNLKVLILIQIIIVLITMGITVWANAFQRLTGSWILTFLIQILEMFIMYVFFAGSTYACYMSSMGMKPGIEDAFYAFRKKARAVLWVILRKCIMIQVYAAIFGFFIGIFTSAIDADSSIALLISGILSVIIVELRYFPAIYLLMEGEEKEAKKAVWQGTDLMKNNYTRLISLYLSFIPWMLLGVLTLGIGLFVVGPWVQVSMAVFYKDLIEREKVKTGAKAEDSMG
ncbi:DUF975 family protein [Anaerostipes sp.]|uniref:DUF975 family protein n=1 Tax=Anaerostipes sp. TaxID=1872530 RepID=UPI0025C6955D|nr:DUF975 family protein [Anaerostipes sp.]MBS7006989.1 DUF975 family protein [Anaerostipes sp.]